MEVPDGRSLAAMRSTVVRRLMALDAHGDLTGEHVAMAAGLLEVSPRTMQRWLRAARVENRYGPKRCTDFALTGQLLELLAYHRGNAAAVHEELRKQAEPGAVVPSLRTVQRAARAQVDHGDRVAMRKGERERRKYDVYLRRPPEYRNAVWETDHVQAPVEVLVHGRLRKPWVTWFIDTTTHAIPGAAVAPGYASSESIMAALRAAISTQSPYGPIGGLPGRVRVDRGKDFLSKVLGDALQAFAVPLIDLPAYGSYLKGTVEGMNGIVETMCFAQMPRYTHGPKQLNGKPIDPDQPALPFEAFVKEFFDFVLEWNTEHTMEKLGGRTPQQAWLQDPTPVFEPPAEDLVHLTLRDDGRIRKIQTGGVHWKGAYYAGTWMSGKVGTPVRLRHMPHHDEEIEIIHAQTGRFLGTAQKSDTFTPKQAADVRRVRESKARRARKLAQAAEKLRNERYAAVTEPGPAVVLGSLTVAQAEAELRDAAHEDLKELALPDFIPLGELEPGWVAPAPRSRKARAEGRP